MKYTLGSRVRFATKVLLTTVFLGLGLYYVWSRKDEFLVLEWPSIYAVAFVAGAFAVNVALRSTYNLITARRLGANLSPGESFMISAVVSAGNFMFPAVGAGIRVLYMKKVHRFPVSHFMSGVFIFLLVTILSVSFAALLLVGVIYIKLDYFRLDLLVLFPLTMFVTITALVIFRGSPGVSGAAEQSWTAAFRGSTATILGERRLVFAALVIVAMSFLVSSLSWSVALLGAAPDIAIAEAFLLSASQMITGFITLTPGAAGFQELAGMYVGQSFTATMTQIFAVLVWVRLVRIAMSVLLAVPSMWILRSRLRVADIDQESATVQQ